MTTCQCCGQAVPEDGNVFQRLAGVKLTRSERDVANMLQEAGGSCVSVEKLGGALWNGRPDNEPEKVAYVLICRMRPKLKAAGLVIDTVHKYGYALRIDEGA